MAQQEKPKADKGHKMGKRTGYELRDGGDTIELAPMYRDAFDRIHHERAGVTRLTHDVASFVQKRQAEIEAEIHRLWNDITEDIGLTLADGWLYGDGTLTRKRKDLATPEPRP